MKQKLATWHSTKASRTEDVGNKCDKNDIMIAWTVKYFHRQREMGNCCRGSKFSAPRGFVIMYLFIVALYILVRLVPYSKSIFKKI